MRPLFRFTAVLLAAGLFPAAAAPRPWTDYRTIMWVGDTVWKKPDRIGLFVQRLKEMGVNTAMVTGDGDAGAWLAAGMPYYVENMVNRGLCLKWHSPVADWDAFVTQWAKSGRPQSALVRPYALNDPAWRAEGRKRVTEAVTKHAPHQPLAYDLRDELSTTISANPFDYDFSGVALEGFRVWLQSQYGGLEALNAQWDTDFRTWDEVMPFTTDRIKNRMAGGGALPRGNPDWQALAALRFDPAEARKQPAAWNFAPWADFRTWMDLSLAEALDDFRQTAHRLDPATPVGIEGTQMASAFGGYDLSRLSRVLDWVEPYDICGSREIFGSFMEGKPFLCTVGESDARAAARRLWHLRLLGDDGCIVWWSEDCIDWKSEDYRLTRRAVELGAVLREMQSPAARLFGLARRETDPVHIHYSQASIQAAWLLESTVDGSTWVRRFSSYEAAHNRHAKVRESWLAALQDLGWSPVFRTGIDAAAAVTVLPQSWALSAAEQAALARAAAGNVVLSSGQPGVFDEHGTLRRAASGAGDGVSPWQALRVGRDAVFTGTPLDRWAERRLAEEPDVSLPQWIAQQLGPLRPPVQIDPGQRVRIHRYTLPGHPARLIALERNLSWRMSEDLKQGGGNEALEKPVTVTVSLAVPGEVYDLRTGQRLGGGVQFRCTVDPWRPALLAVLPEPASGEGLVETLLQAAGGKP